MAFFSGTSGYSYPGWKGHFYPKGTRTEKMLEYYAERLTTTELNHTFYRLPAPGQLAALPRRVGPGFCFAVKAPGTITHRRRLKEVEEPVREFLGIARELGESLGPLLFQLPPNMKADLGRLDALLSILKEEGASLRFALEFRHESWLTDDVYERLRDAGVSLVVGDSDEGSVEVPFLVTGPFIYARLRKTEPYTEAELDAWAERFAQLDVSDTFVYFKHEVQGPAQALSLREKVLSGA